MPAKAFLKGVAAKIGLPSSETLWRKLALPHYERKKASNPAYRTWLDKQQKRIRGHWAHEEVTDRFAEAQLSSQIYEITEMLRRRMGPLGSASVLDAGASDGMFLSLLDVKNGVGVNFLSACVEKIRADGFTAYQVDVEQLPFENKSFDYVVCCETLEHVLNPIRALNELARVCRKRIFITIPWLPQTRLNAKPAGWPDVESHVFEFSEADFRKIVTFSKARPVYRDTIRVFPEPFNPLLQWLFRRYMYGNFFPKLQYYELEPVA
jgi:ubiquinone/menaquinone biosynthesis C-methylase UbiE